MIVKLLGIFDLLAAVMLVMLAAHAGLGWYLLFVGAIIMLAKSLPFIFTGCIACLIDVGVAALFVLSIFFSLPIWLLAIGIFAAAQKGFFSLL